MELGPLTSLSLQLKISFLPGQKKTKQKYYFLFSFAASAIFNRSFELKVKLSI